MSWPASAHAATPTVPSQGDPHGQQRSWRHKFLNAAPNVAAFALLAGIFVVGHHTDWKLPHASQLMGAAAGTPDEWCAEHLVPESICVECNDSLMPKPKEFGFCRLHGVAECVTDHPQLAQVSGTPKLPRYDTVEALALVARPENNSHDTLHLRRVQLASDETAVKAGIKVDVVGERPMSDAVTANGEVTFDPGRVAHLSSRLAGTVAAVFKTVNDAVEQGEIIALIDAAQVGQAKSQLLSAVVKRELRRTTLARLKSHSLSVPASSLTEAEAAFQESEIAFISARQALVNLGFEMADKFDGQDATKLAEEIRFLGVSPALLAKLPGETKTANLLPLRTPYAGVVVSSDVVAGEVVDATKLLFTVADPRSLWLLLSVRQEDARYIAPGLPVEFHTDNGSLDVRGSVSWLSPAVDERTRSLRVCVVLGNSDGRLRDKTFGTARIVLRVEPHAVVVRKQAVQSTSDSQFIFVRDKDYSKEGSPKVFHVRQVRTGARDDEFVELLAGVLPGEVVATDGSAVLLAQLLRSSLAPAAAVTSTRNVETAPDGAQGSYSMNILNRIIDLSLRHRLLVIAAAVASAVAGVLALTHLDVDAFPDTTPVQVQINTVAPALGPEEVERQITFPIEQGLSGLRGLEQIRSISKFGLSQVVVLFKDGTDIYFARQVINERLAAVEIPAGVVRPKMGPVATGLGEVFHYIVAGQGTDLTELRTVHDWIIRPQMRTVPGTAEINSWGGYQKQYHVRIDPRRLIKHDLTFAEVIEAVEKNNFNVGGGNISQEGGMLLVQGLGRTTSLEQIRQIVIRAKSGVPIRVADVADVEIGHEIRRGAVTADGRGEAVLGLGFMLMGENSHTVTWAMKDRLKSIGASVPANIQVMPVYDRTQLVDFVIDTVRKNLFEGGLLVVAVLFAFLGNMRAALIVAAAIPLSMLFAFCGMLRFGIAASLLSLGAIDFGMIVDSSVVMIENCVRQLAREPESGRSRLEIIRDAAVEVRKPTIFGELIIMIVYLPILTLEGIEGKLFRPMALTVIFALVGSMVLSITLMPVLASLLLPRRIETREPWLMRVAHAIHYPILRFAMHHKLAVLGFAAGLLIVAFGMIAPNLGSEFVPQLSEGAVAIGVVRLAGTDLNESIRYNTAMEKVILAAFPDEVEHVWSRIGTAEIATDPMGVELTDVFVTLKPRSQWTKCRTQAEFTEQLDKTLRDMPGQRLAYSQPIEMRMNEMVSGVRADLGVKLFGDDFEVLVKKTAEIEAILRSIPGAADVNTEQLTGQPMLQIKIDQSQVARYGISAQTVLDFVESIGGKPLGEVVEGQLRFPMVARLADEFRRSPEAIRSLLVPTAAGERIPLSRLAKVEIVQGPSTITREWGQRRLSVTANVRGRDLGSFVAEARQKIAAQVSLPTGRYRIEYGGQFENLQRAQTRLLIVVPLVLALIFGLLYATYRNVVDALRVFTGIPFAWVGGIFALWLRDMPFSISAAIGFIALSGVAVLDDMILVSTIRQLRKAGLSLDDAVTQAAITRLRPVLMTTLVASLGFLPMALSDGMGAEVQRPLATVVLGGVIGAMIMSLLVLRVLYVVFNTDLFRRQRPSLQPALSGASDARP